MAESSRLRPLIAEPLRTLGIALEEQLGPNPEPQRAALLVFQHALPIRVHADVGKIEVASAGEESADQEVVLERLGRLGHVRHDVPG